MNNSPPFADSPRESAFHPLQPTESPQITQAPKPSNNSELGTFDKLSALPGNAIPPSPYRSIRNERSVIPTSPSAPSLQGLLSTRPFPTSPESYDVRPLTAEGSGQNSSHQRVSFDSNRTSAPTPNHSPHTKTHVHPLLREAVSQISRGIDSTMTRVNPLSNPTRPSSVVRLAGATNSPKKPGHESPPAASAPHSRATSPIRLFSWSGFHRTHEDPFVPVDPFQIRTRLRRLSFHSPDIEHNFPFDPTCEENPFCCIPPLRCKPEDRFLSLLRDARYFILDTLPRQIYLHLLLRLPSLYFSRIARVYEDAQLSKPDLNCMLESYSSSRQQQQQQQRIVRSSPIPPGAHYHPAAALPFPDEWTSTNVSPALIRFKHSWEAFVDSLLREWKTLNLVSALLLSAIISMFQSQVMANDPVIRTAALLSLTSALMSLSYGCIYIVRFGTMRSMYKATRWAEEAARTTTFILWNVWVLLAMPVVWLAWSMIFFILAILAFVWRYGSSADPTNPEPLSPTAAIGPRIAVSALFFLGLLYLAAIVRTLHNYGRTAENWPFRRMPVESGMPDIQEDDAREERASQGGLGTSSRRDGDRGRESTRASRGRERTRGREQDATEPGGLSAVMGLGLTGLDEFASPRSSDEIPGEKWQHQIEASV